jgi:hypothetical protein
MKNADLLIARVALNGYILIAPEVLISSLSQSSTPRHRRLIICYALGIIKPSRMLLSSSILKSYLE